MGVTLYVVYAIACWVLSIAIISFLNKVDDAVEIGLTRTDAIILLVVSVFNSSTVMLKSEYFDLGNGVLEEIILMLIATLLVVMSYTDFKIKHTYTVINFGLLIACLGYMLLTLDENMLISQFVEQSALVFIFILLMLGLTITHSIGMGDILGYVALSIVYFSSSTFGIIGIMLNIMISNIVFILYNTKNFIHKWKERYALMPGIYVAWIVTLMWI